MRSLSILRLLTAFLLAPVLVPIMDLGQGLEATAAAPEAGREDSASSDGFAAAEALFDAGEFEPALAAARALNTADGFALASRTGLVLMRYFLPPRERAAAIAAALADARRALEMNPGHLEGNLQAAISIGYRGKLRRSIRDAWTGKRYIDNALAHHPENAWALAVLGGWNGEVVIEAGRFFAGTLFGAGRRKAIRHFRAALRAEPGNIAIRTSFAITLLRFDRRRFEAEARTVLAGTISLAAEDAARSALEEMLLQQSRDLLRALQAERRDDLAGLLRRLTAFPGH